MGFIGVQPASVPLTADDVPDLPATKITSGTFPALNGSNLTSLPAANLTGTLPAISGANLTGVSAGKVNQIITMNTSSQTQITGSSFTDTTITASITPSATNSKILIQITDSNMFTHTNSHDDNGMGFRIKRTIGGSAATLVTDNNTYEGFYSSKRGGSDHNRRQHMTWHYVDTTHNTTSAITYMHQIALYRGNDNANGKSVHDNNRGNMTLIEVLA